MLFDNILSHYYCLLTLLISVGLLIIFDFYRKKLKIRDQKYIHKNSIVLITGGCLGIGNDLIRLLIKTKCTLINIDIREKLFKDLNELSSESNSVIHNYKCDLSDTQEIDDTLKKILEKFKRIDFLINNAGVAFNKNFKELEFEEITKTININLLAPMKIMKMIIPIMEKNKFGHIISIGSVLSHIPSDYSPDYVSSKWGLFGFHESVRLGYYENKNLNFTIVCPYSTKTGMFQGFKSPLPFLPMLDSEDVAQIILESIIMKKKVVYIQWFQKYIIMIYKLIGIEMMDLVYNKLIKRTPQNIKTREDNHSVLNLKSSM